MTNRSSSHFSSKKSAIILASLLSASIIFVGVTLAQGLTIPTNLNNAVITIQKIFLSANGVSTDASIPSATISLDGSNGNITTAGPEIKFTHPNYACTSTACILKVDANGLITTTSSLSGLSMGGSGGSFEDVTVWKRTSTTNTNIPATQEDVFFAQPDATDSNKDSIKVRIWVTDEQWISEWNQLVVRDGIETRSNVDITTPLSTAAEKWFIQPNSQNIIASTIENDTGSKAMIISSQIQTGISQSTRSSTIMLQSQNPDVVPTKVAVKGSAEIGYASAPSGDKLIVYGSTRANNYLYNSDRRYKSDIKPLTSALESLLKITGYHYFNKLEGKDSLGVVAQEVEAVYPELVQTDAAGYKSVAYANLVAPIIEAIRELSHKVDSLFDTYVSQQSRIDMLEARLQSLEAQK